MSNCKLIKTSTLRLLGRFTTRLAQTTTGSRLLFALGRHFIARECEKIGNFRVFSWFFLYHHDDVLIR